jgi:hypothetical protein
MDATQLHSVGDRIELTRVGEGGEEWGLYAGAQGTVVEIRSAALIVQWDDPRLNGNDEAMSPTVLMARIDRWVKLETA